jgi:hypothetical protein
VDGSSCSRFGCVSGDEEVDYNDHDLWKYTEMGGYKLGHPIPSCCICQGFALKDQPGLSFVSVDSITQGAKGEHGENINDY